MMLSWSIHVDWSIIIWEWKEFPVMKIIVSTTKHSCTTMITYHALCREIPHFIKLLFDIISFWTYDVHWLRFADILLPSDYKKIYVHTNSKHILCIQTHTHMEHGQNKHNSDSYSTQYTYDSICTHAQHTRSIWMSIVNTMMSLGVGEFVPANIFIRLVYTIRNRIVFHFMCSHVEYVERVKWECTMRSCRVRHQHHQHQYHKISVYWC